MKWKHAQLCGDLDKNLILFVGSLCRLSLQAYHGSTFAAIGVSFLLLAVIYTSQEWKPTVQHCVSAYVFVSWVLFFCPSESESSKQSSHSCFIACRYRWPGVNESRRATRQISKGDWEGLDAFHAVWKSVDGRNTGVHKSQGSTRENEITHVCKHPFVYPQVWSSQLSLKLTF